MQTELHYLLGDLIGRKPLRKLAAVFDCGSTRDILELPHHLFIDALTECNLQHHADLIRSRCSDSPPAVLLKTEIAAGCSATCSLVSPQTRLPRLSRCERSAPLTADQSVGPGGGACSARIA